MFHFFLTEVFCFFVVTERKSLDPLMLQNFLLWMMLYLALKMELRELAYARTCSSLDVFISSFDALKKRKMFEMKSKNKRFFDCCLIGYPITARLERISSNITASEVSCVDKPFFCRFFRFFLNSNTEQVLFDLLFFSEAVILLDTLSNLAVIGYPIKRRSKIFCFLNSS